MTTIQFNDKQFECKAQENLLDAFFRSKIEVPFSCRQGTCQVCLIQAVSGDIPTVAQIGLSQHLKETHHLLPCRCYPSSDMVLKSPDDEEIYTAATITALESLGKHIKSVTIKPSGGLSAYKTGQFFNIKTSLDSKVRSYSFAGQYQGDESFTTHVQKVSGGVFSSWVFDQAKVGDEVQVHYPLGECFVSKNHQASGKLLIATGSGLGAAVAIALEILESDYEKEVHLYHASKDDTGLYMLDELCALAAQYENFNYVPCVSKLKSKQANIAFGPIGTLVFDQFETLKGWEVYLYGNPAMVKSAIEIAVSKQCTQDNIFYDAFDYAQEGESIEVSNKMEFIEEEKRAFKPDPKMWAALDDGKRLSLILNDFYDKVLSDPLLSPFFTGVTKGHIVGKQYAFMNQIFTGNDSYFGDRPRNAHHWMVISDSLFDHREKLFADSCIKCGLQEPFLSQILALDESYREMMVKTRVWPRITDGEIKEIKGFEELVLDIGSICNGCEAALEPGVTVHYHGRTGEMFCMKCQSS